MTASVPEGEVTICSKSVLLFRIFTLGDEVSKTS